MLSDPELEQFRTSLLAWFAAHQRDLPWRRTRDPYAIWISEIMLQQTRVAAVIPYYERFLSRFPDVLTLAAATESDLLAHWAGLGYYHRARNLQKAAQSMDSGVFPATYEEIRALPGIGHYTAAAVASIAFNLPHAVLDGNVFRVLSRVFNDKTNIASGTARTHFTALADKLLDRNEPGTCNQAIMELGATICLPKAPQCLLCPVAAVCRARQAGTQAQLPVKIKLQKSVEEQRTVFWIERDRHLLLWQRPPDSRLMPGFWELPESDHLPHALRGEMLGSFRHGITFHRYVFHVHRSAPPADLGPCRWILLDQLATLPVSTVLSKAKRVIERHRQRRRTAVHASASC